MVEKNIPVSYILEGNSNSFNQISSCANRSNNDSSSSSSSSSNGSKFVSSGNQPLHASSSMNYMYQSDSPEMKSEGKEKNQFHGSFGFLFVYLFDYLF